MFETLLESRDHRHRPFGQTVTSVAVHAAIILVAVREVHVAPDAPPAAPDTSMIFIATPRAAPSIPRAVASAPMARADAMAPMVVPVIDIPRNLPAVTLAHQPFDPRAFTGHISEPGLPIGTAPAVDSSGLGGIVVTSAEADEPPRLLAAGSLRPPAGLEGVPGRVVLSFIVDTLGRAEPASVRVVSSTSPAFDQPARGMVLGSRFAPGRNGGRPVRVLVEQAVSFESR
jgi:TonB family protein